MIPSLYNIENLKKLLNTYVKEKFKIPSPEIKIWKIDAYITFA